jgi:predicted TIM-barrel fold metal-dependent hydrolase
MPKIDFHVHVTPPEIIKNIEKYTAKEDYFALLSSNPKNKFATAEEVIAELDCASFDRAVIFGFAFKDMGLCRMVNDYVIEKVKRYPDRLTGFIAVPPAHKDAVKEIERASAAGLRGAGELFPTGQQFSIEDEGVMRNFSGVCAERSLPVLIHANEPVGHYYPGKTNTTLRQLELFVEHNPSLDIILAHWGGGLFFFEMMAELRAKCKRVYYDCAASPFLYSEQVYNTACNLGLQKRILFGSDYPLIPPARYIEEIERSGISEDDKRALLGGNAEALLNGRCVDTLPRINA